jgi:hypothetical protein
MPKLLITIEAPGAAIGETQASERGVLIALLKHVEQQLGTGTTTTGSITYNGEPVGQFTYEPGSPV